MGTAKHWRCSYPDGRYVLGDERPYAAMYEGSLIGKVRDFGGYKDGLAGVNVKDFAGERFYTLWQYVR